MTLATFGAIAAALVALTAAFTGLMFRGAASGWRDERDAERARGDRLEKLAQAQMAEIDALKARVAELERRTDVERLIEQIRTEHKQTSLEHQQIVHALQSLSQAVTATSGPAA